MYDVACQLPRITELRGRGVAVAAEFGAETWVVRHYQRGGSVMTVLGDRYARFAPPRVLNELRTSEAARARGIATPEIKAGVWYNELWFRRVDVASIYIPASHDLAAVLFENVAMPDAIASTQELLRSVVRGGLLHRDLNLKNILLAPGRAYVLDLDRCAVVGGLSEAQIARMRERFFRSLAKWERRTGKAISKDTVAQLREAFRG